MCNVNLWLVSHIPYYPPKGGRLWPIISWLKMRRIELDFFSLDREHREKFYGPSQAKSLKKTHPLYWICKFEVFKNSDFSSSWGFSIMDLILGFFQKNPISAHLGVFTVQCWKRICFVVLMVLQKQKSGYFPSWLSKPKRSPPLTSNGEDEAVWGAIRIGKKDN